MTRDPDILLRILLGAIHAQEDHDRILELLDELSKAVVQTGTIPHATTLATACRELLTKPSAE
jgi:hypothetical protein